MPHPKLTKAEREMVKKVRALDWSEARRRWWEALAPELLAIEKAQRLSGTPPRGWRPNR